jgi:decaprenylphospho-beta-D-ribofuranose 2-oxidase
MDGTLNTLDPETSFRSLENFGHSLRAASYVVRPTQAEEIPDVFRLARRQGLSVTARGAGLGYNDAALNGGGIILDLAGINRIIHWNAGSGEVLVEPGVTLRQLWQLVEPDGWWPPVVSGTMLTTVGGCLGANVHGKNNFKLGPIGEHVVEFRAVLPSGAEVLCSPQKHA